MLDVSNADAVVEEVTGRVPVEQILRLRAGAWAARGLRPPGRPEDGGSFDAIDAGARHWVVHSGGKVVAAARMSVHRSPLMLPDDDLRRPRLGAMPGVVASLNRLAVDPGHRNRGFGARLDRARIEAARASGCERIVAEAQGSRIPMLESYGFRIVLQVESRFWDLGGVERDVESAVMVLELDSRATGRD